MPQSPEEIKRIQSLLSSLVILTIVILALVLVITAYPTVLKPILAPATPLLPTSQPIGTATLTATNTASPTITRTLRPTLTPSITPTPSQTLTPTITPTMAGPATLTPARPAVGDPYKLVTWTPELAEQAIALLTDYPNLLPDDLRNEDNSGYRQAFQYAAIAQREALLRFPDVPQASGWRLGLAYSLAQLGDSQAGDIYADLIAKALNQAETQIDDLAMWFQNQEPRLRLNSIELLPPQGFVGSRLLEVSGPGSVFIWLLQSSSAFQAQALSGNLSFSSEPEMRTLLSDLDGDGVDEVAIFNFSPDKDILEKPRVFNLSKAQARELTFQLGEDSLNIGTDFTNYWQIVKNEQGENDLQFVGRVFPVCPVNIIRTYHWDGEYLSLVDDRFQVEPVTETSNLCGYIVDHAANVWGPEAAIQIMETLLPEWPPAKMEDGKPFPPDVKDEWRYRLGVYYAQVGDLKEAIRYMSLVAKEPIVANSQWIQPAQAFLATYKKPENIYTACVEARFCDPAFSLDYLINKLYDPSRGDVLQFLAQSGAQLRSSGYFDFDQDGQTERWFTIRHRPLGKLELWILASTRDGSRALYVNPVNSDAPSFSLLEEKQKPAVVRVEDELYISLLRNPDTALPYLTYVTPDTSVPTLFQEALPKARLALFSGEDPAEVAATLEAVYKQVTRICQARNVCDELLYLLGLANEMSGNERAAVTFYLRLWSDYAQSPFTTLARLKLLSTLNTPTPTQTLTSTTTPTQGTPTPTVSPGGPTTTPTQTPTQGVYPPPPSTQTPNTPYP